MINPESVSISSFLTSWYGPPISPISPVSPASNWLPEPLKEWYRLSSQWGHSLTATRRIRNPDQIIIDDTMAIFMEDATGDWRWAFDTEHPDSVYDAELGEKWEQVAEGLAELLIHNALSEATYNATSWRECGQVPEEHLPSILRPMTEIAFGGWRWPKPGGRIYMSESLIAEVLPAMKLGAPWKARSGYAEVRVASPHPGKLSFVDEIQGLEWIRK